MTRRAERAWEWAALAVGLLGAAAVTRGHAGGWNDGSRLAAAECLVERRTWVIDDSVFLRPPADGPSPYPADNPFLQRFGTLDRLRIGGHWYTDKPPLSVLPLAAAYGVLHAATGDTVRGRPERFCRTLTFATSGAAFAVAVWSLCRLGRRLGLAPPWRLALAASLTFGGVAWSYAGYANSHILLLATAAALFAEMARPRRTAVRVLLLGCLAGVSYGLDLGAGPPLLAVTGLWALCRLPRRGVLLFALAALPWLALHHGITYMLAGTWKPANAVPEYLAWPGSPFVHGMTGRWNHSGVGAFLLYALDLLFGKKGYLPHNPPLLLAVVGLPVLLRRRPREAPELLAAAAWAAATWLLYAVSSNNLSGICCSVRWFVPLAAPGGVVLAVLLRERPAWRADFAALAAWGSVLAALAAWHGCWMDHLIPGYWVFVGLALLSWGLVVLRRARRPAPMPATLPLRGPHRPAGYHPSATSTTTEYGATA